MSRKLKEKKKKDLTSIIMSNGSDVSCSVKTHHSGFFHIWSLNVNAINHRLRRIFGANSLGGSMCEKGFGMVNPVCFWYSCKLTESVWTVSVEPGNASGG